MEIDKRNRIRHGVNSHFQLWTGHFGSMDLLVSKQTLVHLLDQHSSASLFLSNLNHSTILGKSHYFSPNLANLIIFPNSFFDFFFQFRALIIIYLFFFPFFSSSRLNTNSIPIHLVLGVDIGNFSTAYIPCYHVPIYKCSKFK